MDETTTHDDARTIDARIGDVAAAHHGLIDSRHLAGLGVSRKALRWRLDNGRLVPVHPGVHRVHGAPETFEQQVLAACWGAGPGAAASHRTAAALVGLRLPGDVPIEVTVLSARAPELEGVIVHRSTDLLPEHVEQRGPIPVTITPRLLADLGAVVPWWLVERALEQSLVAGLTTIGEVRRFRERFGRQGRNGIGVLGEILDRRGLGDEHPHSVLESMIANLTLHADLPRPVYQLEVLVPGGRRFIDFAYPEQKIAIEVLGYEPHSSRSVFQADCLRGNQLTLLGWQVLEFTWDDVVHRPGYVVATIRQALLLAGHPDVALAS